VPLEAAGLSLLDGAFTGDAALSDDDDVDASDVEPLDAVDAVDAVDGAASVDVPPDVASPALEDLRAAAPRSFFAQPDPLKCTAGAETAFRTELLWQTGQLDGPSVWTPWITSNRWPQ
jgi:hypothetical protein